MIARDFYSFSFDMRGLLAFDRADSKERSYSFVGRGEVMVLRGGRKILFSRDHPF